MAERGRRGGDVGVRGKRLRDFSRPAHRPLSAAAPGARPTFFFFTHAYLIGAGGEWSLSCLGSVGGQADSGLACICERSGGDREQQLLGPFAQFISDSRRSSAPKRNMDVVHYPPPAHRLSHTDTRLPRASSLPAFSLQTVRFTHCFRPASDARGSRADSDITGGC